MEQTKSYIKFHIDKNEIQDNVRKIVISKLQKTGINDPANAQNIYELNVIVHIARIAFARANVCFGDLWNNSLYWVNTSLWK